ncbi:MAG: cupin domain-containing protein [Planctomycetota bacterium]|nr:cupin domain-containing protein [Planctomycetota bacterium]
MFIRFLLAAERQFQRLPFGEVARLSDPKFVGAEKLTVMDVKLNPGGGHGFHFHPGQEELIYVLEGRIEQWLEAEAKVLGPGDALFIPRATVHASYNVFAEAARVLAILGPCAGNDGYEVVDVFEQAPWKDLKGPVHA